MIRQLILSALLAAPARAVEWVPVIDSQLMLGQVFQGGTASSWQGHAGLQVTPAVKFSDKLGLIPTYSGGYQGTKSVTDLGSGGQLFQDSMTHSLQLKGIWRPNERWKVKPILGQRFELLRETSDEKWGKGLFDYRKPSAGLELEFSPAEKVKLTGSYDYYRITFTNYRSLESRAAPGLGREQAEARTLDSTNHAGTLGASFPLPVEGSWGRLTLGLTNRSYPEQHLVVTSGNLTAENRIDRIKTVGAQAFYGRQFSAAATLVAGLGYSFTRYRSNQNHYDAELNVFNREFYSYEERSIQPSLSMTLGKKKVEWSFTYLRIERDYLGRASQDASGSYQNRTTRIDQDSFLMDLTIPLAHRFKLLARAGVTKSHSNNTYEKTFKYNYTLSNHLVGFSWSY